MLSIQDKRQQGKNQAFYSETLQEFLWENLLSEIDLPTLVDENWIYCRADASYKESFSPFIFYLRCHLTRLFYGGEKNSFLKKITRGLNVRTQRIIANFLQFFF